MTSRPTVILAVGALAMTCVVPIQIAYGQSVAGAAGQGAPAATLQVAGPGAAALRAEIEERLGSVVTVQSADGGTGHVLAVQVTVSGRGRRARASIVASAADGTQLASREMPRARGARGRAAVARSTADVVRAAIEALDRRRLAERARAEQERRARSVADREAREAARLRSEAGERRDSEERPRLRVLSGFGLRARTLEVTLASGDSAGHESGLFPELLLSAGLRPFARAAGWLSGLHVDLDAALGVGLSAAEQGSEPVSAGAFRFMGSIGYRHPIGPLELGGGVGFGVEAFSLDANGAAPSTSYSFFRVGPSATLDVLDHGLLRVRVDAGLRLPVAAGEITDVYGPAGILGLDVSAAAEGQIGRLAYGLAVGVSRFGVGWHDHDAHDHGSAESAEGEEALDASDTSFGLMLLAGYRIF